MPPKRCNTFFCFFLEVDISEFLDKKLTKLKGLMTNITTYCQLKLFGENPSKFFRAET